MRLPSPSQEMIRRHIEDPEFVRFFKAAGGGCDPTGLDMRPDSMMPSADQARVRGYLLDKLLRYVIAYQAQLPPACGKMNRVMRYIDATMYFGEHI